MKSPLVKLSNNILMPAIGLGTWKSKLGEVENAVKAAIDCGYRHIDCAYAYGNESEVGVALNERIQSGGVKREELFICSKLWNTRHTPSDVRPSCLESLSNLGLDYLDLYLIHWPLAFKPGKELFPKDCEGNVLYDYTDPLQTWNAMEALVDEGLVKCIGLSNFNSQQIERILTEARIKPTVLQVEIHPYFQNSKLIEFCQLRDIVVTAYSPLASPDRPWASADEPQLLEDPQLKSIAQKHSKSPAQVVLRWLLQRNLTLVPKSVTPSRIKENFEVTDFELCDEDMQAIKALDKNTRLILPQVVRNGKVEPRDKDAAHYPYHIEF